VDNPAKQVSIGWLLPIRAWSRRSSPGSAPRRRTSQPPADPRGLLSPLVRSRRYSTAWAARLRWHWSPGNWHSFPCHRRRHAVQACGANGWC